VHCTADEKGKCHVIACPKVPSFGTIEATRHTAADRRTGTKSGFSTWFERVRQIVGYQKLASTTSSPFLSSSTHMATTQVSPFPTPPQCPLTPRLLQHYLWAGGHFVLLISALRYFLATITLKAVSSWWYKGLSLRLDFIGQWLITLIV